MLVLPDETLPEGTLHLLIYIRNDPSMIILILIRLTSDDLTLEINALLV